MTYAEETQANATAAQATVLALVATYAAKELVPAELAALTAATVARANARAVLLADLGLAATLSRLRRGPVPHLGLTLPLSERDRIAEAISTTLDGDEAEYGIRLGRLANAEPLETGRQAFHEGMAVQGVQGWTRQAQPDACQLCKSLADGSVVPINKKIIDHPGCACRAVPVEDVLLPSPGGELPLRTFYSGHGTHRREYRNRPGLTFSRPRPPRGRVR